jgi:hypothetical protein
MRMDKNKPYLQYMNKSEQQGKQMILWNAYFQDLTRNDREMFKKWPRMNSKIWFTTINDGYNKPFSLAIHEP